MKNQIALINLQSVTSFVIFFLFILRSASNYSLLKNENLNSTREINKMLYTKLHSNETIITCKNHCSFHGYCSEGICFCKPGYTGEDCSIKLEKSNLCINNCSVNGRCDQGLCLCNKNFGGVDCSLSKNLIKQESIAKMIVDTENVSTEFAYATKTTPAKIVQSV